MEGAESCLHLHGAEGRKTRQQRKTGRLYFGVQGCVCRVQLQVFESGSPAETPAPLSATEPQRAGHKVHSGLENAVKRSKGAPTLIPPPPSSVQWK